MGFTFSGMMRGLGTGLVSTGALMEKYNERKFEEEKLKTQLDRQERIENLKLKAASEENILNRQHAENLQKDNWEFTTNLEKERTKRELAQQEKEFKMWEISEGNAAEARRSQAAYQQAMLNKESDAMRIFRENQAALDRWSLKLAGGDKEKAQQIKDELTVKTSLGLNKKEDERLPPVELIQFAEQRTKEAAKKLPRSKISDIQAQYKKQTGEDLPKTEAKAYWEIEQTKKYLKSFGYDVDKNQAAENSLLDIIGNKYNTEQPAGTTAEPPPSTSSTPPNLGDEIRKAQQGDPAARALVEEYIKTHSKSSDDPYYFVAAEAQKALASSSQPNQAPTKSAGVLSRTADAVKDFSQRNVTNNSSKPKERPTRDTIRLDELTRSRYGTDKTFDSLPKSSQRIILREFNRDQK